jgi:hypothetical protein
VSFLPACAGHSFFESSQGFLGCCRSLLPSTEQAARPSADTAIPASCDAAHDPIRTALVFDVPHRLRSVAPQLGANTNPLQSYNATAIPRTRGLSEPVSAPRMLTLPTWHIVGPRSSTPGVGSNNPRRPQRRRPRYVFRSNKPSPALRRDRGVVEVLVGWGLGLGLSPRPCAALARQRREPDGPPRFWERLGRAWHASVSRDADTCSSPPPAHLCRSCSKQHRTANTADMRPFLSHALTRSPHPTTTTAARNTHTHTHTRAQDSNSWANLQNCLSPRTEVPTQQAQIIVLWSKQTPSVLGTRDFRQRTCLLRSGLEQVKFCRELSVCNAQQRSRGFAVLS